MAWLTAGRWHVSLRTRPRRTPQQNLDIGRSGNDNIATNATIYEYANGEIGNWIERHEYHLWRDDSYQSKRLTTRTLAYN